METEPQIVEEYVATGKVRLVYRHLVQLGEDSMRAAEASECAADQGKFWEMRRLLYERQRSLYGEIEATLAGLAGELGLDDGAFASCMQSGTHRPAIEADFRAAQEAGVRSRPVFDVGATRLVGAQPIERFREVIEAELAR